MTRKSMFEKRRIADSKPKSTRCVVLISFRSFQPLQTAGPAEANQLNTLERARSEHSRDW